MASFFFLLFFAFSNKTQFHYRSTTAKSVQEALANADIEVTEIHCLQHQLNSEVIVSFKSIASKEKFLRLNLLEVGSKNYALQDVDEPFSSLTIYDTPFELSDLAITKCLSPFCEVLHYRWESIHSPPIFTMACGITVFTSSSLSRVFCCSANIKSLLNTTLRSLHVISAISPGISAMFVQTSFGLTVIT